MMRARAASGRRSQATCALARPSTPGAAAKPAAPAAPVMKVLAPPTTPRFLVPAAATATTATPPPPADPQQQHDPPLLLAAPSLDSVRDQLVRDELPGLFSNNGSNNNNGPTPSLYSEGVVFQDPLAATAGFPLYQVGIGAIRALFDVELVTHAAVVRESESAVVTRWTMVLKPRGVPEGGLPFLTGAARRPSVALTGTSAYGVCRLTGRIVSHVDTWDSLPMRLQSDARRRARAPAGASALGGDGAAGDGVGSDGEGGGGGALLLPPRPRGLLHFARRAVRAALAVTPDLATPHYDVLYASPVYELRRYGRFALAETKMAAGASPAGGDGFGPLAGYIFGGNDAGKRWEMTTPVLTDTAAEAAAARSGGGGGGGGGEEAGGRGAPRATMAFVIDDEGGGEQGQGQGGGGGGGGGGGDDASATTTTTFAAPRDPAVSTRFERGGRLWASVPVAGWPLAADVSRAERRLRASLVRDGVARAASAPGQYRLLRYNDPFTPPFLRRNELLVEVEWCRGGAAAAAAEEGGSDNAPWAEALLATRRE